MSPRPFLQRPSPDFAQMERVIRGECLPQRVHLIELGIDVEIMRQLTEHHLGGHWIPLGETSREGYYRQIVELHYRLGYDLVRVRSSWVNHPEQRRRIATDTHSLPHGQRGRGWAEEGLGLITSWEDFERFPWDKIKGDVQPCEITARCLPEGMKMAPVVTMFTHVQVTLLGSEGLFFLLHDDPELVSAVFQRWGQIVYDFYADLIEMDEIGALWLADDLGYTTSTMIAPRDIRRYILPWFRRLGELAHAHGKTFWLHCCGNIYDTSIVNDLVGDVQLDALHSFQDSILPVTEFQRIYGSSLAALGGVDMDKLCRMDEATLREYTRGILDACMPTGRFAFGSGNTIANYVPAEHYLWMIDEAQRWANR